MVTLLPGNSHTDAATLQAAQLSGGYPLLGVPVSLKRTVHMVAGHSQNIKKGQGGIQALLSRLKCALSIRQDATSLESILFCGGGGGAAWQERGTSGLRRFKNSSVALSSQLFPGLMFSVVTCALKSKLSQSPAAWGAMLRKASFSSAARPPRWHSPVCVLSSTTDISSHRPSFPLLFSLSVLVHDFLIPLLSSQWHFRKGQRQTSVLFLPRLKSCSASSL